MCWNIVEITFFCSCLTKASKHLQNEELQIPGFCTCFKNSTKNESHLILFVSEPQTYKVIFYLIPHCGYTLQYWRNCVCLHIAQQSISVWRKGWDLGRIWMCCCIDSRGERLLRWAAPLQQGSEVGVGEQRYRFNWMLTQSLFRNIYSIAKMKLTLTWYEPQPPEWESCA